MVASKVNLLGDGMSVGLYGEFLTIKLPVSMLRLILPGCYVLEWFSVVLIMTRRRKFSYSGGELPGLRPVLWYVMNI